ncbi:unnamed protein product [Darwinula stevensoni]|uniref:EGF-like domain-containing protein n=1 Tax=Darwinula stevensoni TaxID=69355 RepID=A0A7R8XD98_9CRUS|nr:unnamed protein product [Darwinula stevensoni]CAG0889630.1 unnamed protein product [Darwinula stevensoni]
MIDLPLLLFLEPDISLRNVCEREGCKGESSGKKTEGCNRIGCISLRQSDLNGEDSITQEERRKINADYRSDDTHLDTTCRGRAFLNFRINVELTEEDRKFAIDSVAVHNTYRVKHGVSPLKLDENMWKEAKEWVRRMNDSEEIMHLQGGKYGVNVYCAKYTVGNFTISSHAFVERWYSEIEQHRYDHEPTGKLSTAAFDEQCTRDDECDPRATMGSVNSVNLLGSGPEQAVCKEGICTCNEEKWFFPLLQKCVPGSEIDDKCDKDTPCIPDEAMECSTEGKCRCKDGFEDQKHCSGASEITGTVYLLLTSFFPHVWFS